MASQPSYGDVFDDEVAPPQTVHRIRANSSIMHLNKILGELWLVGREAALEDLTARPIGLRHA